MMPTFYSIGTLGEPLFRSLRHSHHSWEICLYVLGEGTITVGTTRLPFHAGSIICLPPEIPHEELSADGCNLFFIHTDTFHDNSVTVPVFHDSQDQRFQRLTMLLYQEFLLQETGWQEMTQQLFHLLLSYLHRWRAGHAHPLVEQLQHSILHNFHDGAFTISDAMEGMPMSPDHLRRLFEQGTGKTPMHYLTDLRINEAKQLLQTRSFTIKDVARRVGYPDPYYFSRLFHKVTGIRPSDYTKRDHDK